MRAGLSSDRKTFVDGVLYNLGNHRVADMADVDTSAGGPCHINHILCRYIFCPDIVRIQKITNFLFTCAVVFGLGFFFPFQYLSIFLAVETTKCVVRLQNLESFPHISEVDGREEVPVRTGESFESGNATVVKIHQIVYVVFDGIWLVVVIPYKSAPQCVVYEGMTADFA